VLSIAAELNDDFDIKIIDQRTDKNWKERLKKLLRKKPFCVGISSMTGNQINHAINMMKAVREESDVPIVWGGVHASLLPRQTLESKYVDYVIRGEGEKTFYELLDFLKNKPKRKELREIKGLAFFDNGNYIHAEERPFLDPNELKRTPWHLVNVEDYIHSNVVVKGSKRELDIGETSRGCPYKCGFCYNAMFHKSIWRTMSVEKSVEKIKWHVKKFNLDVIWLRDDEYFTNPKRCVDISKKLVEDNVKIKWYSSGIRIDLFEKLSDEDIRILVKSGCEGFRFGIESGNNRILKLIRKNITREQVFDANKRCRRLNVTPHYAFMAGFPTETIREVYDTLNMMEKLKKDNPKAKVHVINLFTPYPGGELFNMLKEKEFKTPKTLEGWIDFHHLRDFALHLTKSERKILRNIADVSYFTSEAMLDALPDIVRILFKPMKAWLGFRKDKKRFIFMPEVFLLRKMRNAFMKH
jgi:radical SAM superfamily enzyme YgiQ (UPF0313 family)